MTEYKNIIFDLGGVVFDIDYKLTIESFRNLGIPDAESFYSKASQVNLFDNLEKGIISEKDFFDGIRDHGKSNLSDEQIRNAWNALLIGLPEENVKILTELKKKYRLFLLSNTNSIHEKGYREMITNHYGKFVMEDLFEKMFLSHHLHMRKPDPEIFLFLLNDRQIKLEETCFIDDSIQHVEAARRLNIFSVHLQTTLSDVVGNW